MLKIYKSTSFYSEPFIFIIARIGCIENLPCLSLHEFTIFNSFIFIYLLRIQCILSFIFILVLVVSESKFINYQHFYIKSAKLCQTTLSFPRNVCHHELNHNAGISICDNNTDLWRFVYMEHFVSLVL